MNTHADIKEALNPTKWRGYIVREMTKLYINAYALCRLYEESKTLIGKTYDELHQLYQTLLTGGLKEDGTRGRTP